MIKADRLTKIFGPVKAVNEVSFEVEKGEIVGFLGSNAAGKTTTMRMLTCYFPPTSGTATVAGFDVLTQSLKVRENVGYLPENVPLYKDMPVDYFLEFVGSLKGLRGKDLKEKIETSIEKCGLQPVFEEEIGNLSKGYRQRVGIAQAIINEPPVLILDEPTVGLDPKQIIEIRNLIKSFKEKSTVILSSHILHEIEQVCDRILIIDYGEILAYDTRENLSKKLFKKNRLKLTVEGPSEKVKEILKKIDGVSKVQDAGKIDKNVYTFKMLVPRDTETRKAIVKRLTDNDFRLVEMGMEHMSVEDIFRKIVPDRKPVSREEAEAEPDRKEKSQKDKKEKEAKE